MRNKVIDATEFVAVREVWRRYRLHHAIVRCWVRAGKVGSRGQGRTLRVRVDDVERTLREHIGGDRRAQVMSREIGGMQWTATDWERNWEAIASRLTNAPPCLTDDTEFQIAASMLDWAFERGDAQYFSVGAFRVVELCRDTIQTQNIGQWW